MSDLTERDEWPEAESFPAERYPLQALTGRIIEASFAVHREFGFGFLEAVYRRALAVELRYKRVPVAEEVPYELFHRGVSIGLYRADLVVDSQVIVETKTGLAFPRTAAAQTLNCIKVAGLPLGLVIHFGTSVKIKRVIGPKR